MRLVVARKGADVAWIERTPHGASLAYTAPTEVALSMPYRSEPYEATGLTLHPYFVNLLPEDALLERLARNLGTSPNDFFTLLADLGEDVIGDLSFRREGEIQSADEKAAFDPERQSFREIFEAKYGNRRPERSSIPGAQPKMSSYRVALRLTTKNAGPSLLKLSQDERFPLLIENEHFFMRMAAGCGLRAARTTIVTDCDGDRALSVLRFDRVATYGRIDKLRQEDGCQLLDLLPEEKYNPSIEQVGAGVRRLLPTWRPICLQMMVQLAFSFMIGNHDHHAKNVSVLETGSGQFALSPAYGLLTTLPYIQDESALAMNGKKDEFRRSDFLECGEAIGLPSAAVARAIDAMLARAEPWIDRVGEIGFDEGISRNLREELHDRRSALLG